MPALSAFTSDEARESAQKAVHVIYVEGKDDVEFLNFLYTDRVRDIEFKWSEEPSSDPAIPTNGGCEGVIARVRAERMSRDGTKTVNTRVYGIVDRDIYKKRCNWPAFLEPDNNNFPAAIDDGIVVVLRRWEIENYFADPSVLRYTASRMAQLPEQRSIGEEAVADILINLCERLIVISAASIVLQQHGRKDLAPGWGSPLAGSVGDLERSVTDHLSQNHPVPGILTDFHVRLAEVRRFDCGGADKQARLSHLLRIVDGKRLFAHLETTLHFPRQICRLAASDCRERQADTEDLADFIRRLIN